MPNLMKKCALLPLLLWIHTGQAYSLFPSNRLQAQPANFVADTAPPGNLNNAIPAAPLPTFPPISGIQLQTQTQFQPNMQVSDPSGLTQILTPQGLQTLPYWLAPPYPGLVPVITGGITYINN